MLPHPFATETTETPPCQRWRYRLFYGLWAVCTYPIFVSIVVLSNILALAGTRHFSIPLHGTGGGGGGNVTPLAFGV